MAKKFELNTRLGVKKKLNKAADIVVEKEPEKIRKMRRFVEHHKKMVLLTFMLFVAVVAAMLGIINYNTAYEYSYNGHALGVVKDKEDVLKITELVQNALTEERDVEVVMSGHSAPVP